MTAYSGKNIFEKLGALIPGYRGYSERQGRRETNKIFRDTVAKRLMEKSTIFDRAINKLVKDERFSDIELLDGLRRQIICIAVGIRYCNYGECGLFDLVQIDEASLEKLHTHDLRVANHLDFLMSDLEKMHSDLLERDPSEEELGCMCSAADMILGDFDSTWAQRDGIFREI